ncbi:MAG: PEP-CTERM sorting domain-containing protein [Telluria sp.]
MIKTKLALFLAAATLSFSANAAFIQYNVSGASFDDGGVLSGYFVQNTDDKAIAYFDLRVAGGTLLGVEFFGSGQMSNIVSATTFYTGAGPTNFAAFNDQDTTYHYLDLQFGLTSTPGTYGVMGYNTESGATGLGRLVTAGTVSEGTIDPFLLASLEMGDQYVSHIVPEYIGDPAALPEPGSLALLMLGVAGIAGAGRRKAGGSGSETVRY